MPESIESIARSRERWVEANRENGFEAGIKRLLTELYPDNAHFIYELLQNAEDAHAREVRFILHEDRIEFEHDGQKLFSLNDVKAITSIGFSTKRDDTTNIGKFGVGFKAVFAYTESPEIQSGDFHFRIYDMVVPRPNGRSGKPSDDRKTRFVLPFNNPKKPTDTARSEIESLLRALDAATLLFLTRIHKIEYLLPDSSLGYIERVQLDENRFEIRVQHPGETSYSSTCFIKFDKEVQVEDDEAEEAAHSVKSCRIALAFALSPIEVASKSTQGGNPEEASQWALAPIDPGRVCIYFPADKETSNLRFHVHAPFASTVARDSVRDSAGNNILRGHLADLLAESMHLIRKKGLLTVPSLALLPNDKDNLSEFYQPLRTRLVQEFQDDDLVPLKHGGHAAASYAVRGGKALSDLIDDEGLATLLHDREFPPEWAANPAQRNQREDNFLSMLDIEEWKEEDLVTALSKMGDEARSEWLSSKENAWHQALYALLHEHADELEDIPIVKTSDGKYRVGNECFFPTEDIEQDDNFPRVAKATFSTGKSKDQQKRARSFLETVGVREVDEAVEIEALLKRYYRKDSERPTRKEHYSHVRRFMHFMDKASDARGLFRTAYLFMVDSGDGVEWAPCYRIYIDVPFLDTGLGMFFGLRSAGQTMRPLSPVYEKSGLNLQRIANFAKCIGARTRLLVQETLVTEEHPEWSYLDRNAGERCTKVTNSDYHVRNLDAFLAAPSIEKSMLVWRTMKELCEKQEHKYLYAYYGLNNSKIARAKSTLVHDLMKAQWLPQKRGKGFEFVQPRDAVAERLPNGFEYDSGWVWLQSIKFGEGVKEQQEAKRREQRRQKEEYKQREQLAIDSGFKSLEEMEEVASLINKAPDFLEKLRESQKPKPEFPEHRSADPDRRKRKAAESVIDAPPKEYDKKLRSVRTSRTHGKAGVDDYLRSAYSNDAEQLICQICQEEMPFRKKDSQHYFERVEAFELPIEDKSNHLALCPVCAAKYEEFVFHGQDDARDRLREVFIEMESDLELPVTLGDENATIRFVETHAIDLRSVVNASTSQ